MFSSNQYIKDVHDVPSKWIFENYLNLEVPLTGNRIKIKSLFNLEDKIPSMFLYYNVDCNCYKFKCFSTGRAGSAIDLMMYLWGMKFKECSQKIIRDYIEFLKTGNTPVKEDFEIYSWKVADYVFRKWSTADVKYWTRFNIGSNMLEKHNVKPISKYKMQKTDSEGNVLDSFSISSNNIYGYFNHKHELCKLYQPLNKMRKFIKVTDYIQGYDQLNNNDCLVIASSLKDIMAIKSLGFKIDAIAPHSENTLINPDMIKDFQQNYQSIVSVLDSDQAGIRAMKEYEEKHGITFCYLPLEKDISDIIKYHGKDIALRELSPKLNNAIEKYLENN